MKSDDLAKTIKIHRIYRHFKGNSYIVEGIAEHSETEEPLVLYRALYEEGKLYARPLKIFTEKLDQSKYPSAKQKHRFELLEIDSQNKSIL